VVIVVPPLAEAEHAEEEVISALIMAAEWPAAPEVADRVDTPGNVVD
jgi:hypothetical protein